MRFVSLSVLEWETRSVIHGLSVCLVESLLIRHELILLD